jgi:hypothetical protein
MHFTNRYYKGDHLTHAFFALNFRRGDRRELVERVMRGQTSNESEILSAILIIVFRLRNNLFHGTKWAYGIQGQLANFRNANKVLMSVIEMHQS